MRLNIFKGQSIIEYALLLAIVVAAFIGMQTYMKRGIQAGIKFCADEIGEQKESEKKDPTKGELLNAVSTDIADGTTTITLGEGGSYKNVISQDSSKGEGSYSLYRAGFTEGKFFSGSDTGTTGGGTTGGGTTGGGTTGGGKKK